MSWTENWHVWGEGRLIEGLVGKTEEERTLGKPRRRRNCNIIMDLQEVGWGIVGTDLVQDKEKRPPVTR